MEVRIALPRINRVLGAAVGLLVVAGLGAELFYHYSAEEHWLIEFFSLSEEANLPTWYASALLLACALLLAAIAAQKRRRGADYVAHWAFLALVFGYISLDETVQIHELLSLWDLPGIFYFSWVIPAGIAVVLLGLVYFRFLLHLPPATRVRMVSAGAVFIGGALGVELVLGWWTDVHGDQNLGYSLIDLVEESMELAGVSLFCSALVRYLGAEVAGMRIAVDGGDVVSLDACRPGE